MQKTDKGLLQVYCKCIKAVSLTFTQLLILLSDISQKHLCRPVNIIEYIHTYEPHSKYIHTYKHCFYIILRFTLLIILFCKYIHTYLCRPLNIMEQSNISILINTVPISSSDSLISWAFRSAFLDNEILCLPWQWNFNNLYN